MYSGLSLTGCFLLLYLKWLFVEKKKGPNQTLQIIKILCVLSQQTLNVRSMFSSNNKEVYLTKKATDIEQKKFLRAISILYILLVLTVWPNKIDTKTMKKKTTKLYGMLAKSDHNEIK